MKTEPAGQSDLFFPVTTVEFLSFFWHVVSINCFNDTVNFASIFLHIHVLKK